MPRSSRAADRDALQATASSPCFMSGWRLPPPQADRRLAPCCGAPTAGWSFFGVAPRLRASRTRRPLDGTLRASRTVTVRRAAASMCEPRRRATDRARCAARADVPPTHRSVRRRRCSRCGEGQEPLRVPNCEGTAAELRSARSCMCAKVSSQPGPAATRARIVARCLPLQSEAAMHPIGTAYEQCFDP